MKILAEFSFFLIRLTVLDISLIAHADLLVGQLLTESSVAMETLF